MKNIILAILLLAALPMSSQVTFQPKVSSGPTVKGVVYEKEHTGHLKFHTHGFALGYDIGKLKSFNETEYYTFEIGSLKHPKEYRQRFRTTSASLIGRPIIYGKQNSVIAMRAMYKKKKYLSEKAKQKGIAIGYAYSFGVTAALLKPYYITVVDYDSPWNLNYRSIKYEESTKEDFLNYNSISGAESFFKGLGEAKLVPGLTGDISVVFDLGAYEAFARSLEAGLMVDIYTQNMPIMIDSPNFPYFINVYLNFHFGKRW